MRDKQYPLTLTCKEYILAVIYGMSPNAAEVAGPKPEFDRYYYRRWEGREMIGMKSQLPPTSDFNWVSTIFGTRVWMPKSQEEFKMGMQSVAKRRRKTGSPRYAVCPQAIHVRS